MTPRRKESRAAPSRYWQYRIVKRRLQPPETGDWYGIHECHFLNGALDAIGEEAATIESDTQAGVNEVRVMMFQAIRSPVIDYDAFVASLKSATPSAPTTERA